MSEFIAYGLLLLLAIVVVVILGFVYRCRGCGRWWGLRRTDRERLWGKFERWWWVGDMSAVEYRCKHCSNSEWRAHHSGDGGPQGQ